MGRTPSFQVLELSRLVELVIGIIVPVHRDRSADLAGDLSRLKNLVESAVPSSRSA